MTTQQAILAHRDEILSIAAKHGATNVRVFGSVARGAAGPNSDPDLLVDVGPNPSPRFPASLMLELEDLLGCDVDVVEAVDLHHRIRDRVLAEARPL